MIPHVENFNTRLLPHFALDGVFERFAGLDKPG
jgi:hypothetical protein